MADTERQTSAVAAPPAPANRSETPTAGTNGANTAPPNGTSAEGIEENKKKPPKFIGPVIGVAAVVLDLVFGIPYYQYSKTHEGTDDAYITGNLVNVSPIISGTVNLLTVEEGDTIKKGTLIARLEDSSESSALRQAQAAYDAANSQIPQAQTSLEIEKAQTQATIDRAQASLAAQQAKTSGASAQLQQTRGASDNGLTQAQAQYKAAVSAAAQAGAQRDSAFASYKVAQQAISTAQHASLAAQSNIASAQANAVKADNDSRRYARLVAQDAVTRQQYDSAVAAAATANAQLTSAQQQYQQSLSQVAQAQASAQQALATASAAGEAAQSAQSQVSAAHAEVLIAEANLNNIGVQQGNVLNNAALITQAQADLATARTGGQQIDLKRQQIYTVRAQAASAHAQLVNAQVQESDTVIVSPTDGEVVHKAVNVGASVTPGQTLVTLTQGDDVWVTANYKETQLEFVRAGQPAEVKVDAFPGKIFKGKVDSVNQATGASTALLPPDNATGNFTKVVQRIPVKIVLFPDTSGDKNYATADDIKYLRQGESVTATIDTSSAQK